MPRKKTTRVPSRAKPILRDESLIEAEMHQETRREKLNLLLKDFDIEVEKRVNKMEAEILIIQEKIHQIFKMELMSYPEATRSKLWINYMQQQENTKASSVVKDSVMDIISSADNVLQSVAKKRGRKPKKQQLEENDEVFLAPPTVTRTTRGNRQKAVLTSNQCENMPPPTTRRNNMKAKEAFITPMHSNFVPSQFMVTPKFDPRTPLPTGTVKRKPLMGEVVISIAGSPLQVSPQPIIPKNVDEWLDNLKADNMDDNMKTKLKEFHTKVEEMLNM